jgi:hypothetical protein
MMDGSRPAASAPCRMSAARSAIVAALALLEM